MSREEASEHRRETTVAVVTIGNELLTGKVTDLNLSFLVAELRALGAPLVLALIVPDVEAAIVDAVRYAAARADLVLTTGGIGPTHDDVTLAALARAFSKRLVRNESLERAIRAHYGARTNDDVLRMADLPEGARVIEDPGLTFPLFEVENVVVFPGDPVMMKQKFGLWKERLRSAPFALRRLYLDADEADIAADLRSVEGAHGVAIGSYPKYDGAADWRVLVTIESKDRGRVEAAASDLLRRLKPGHLVRAEG